MRHLAWTRLVTLHRTWLYISRVLIWLGLCRWPRLSRWLWFVLVLRGRTLRITSRLGDHDAVSVTLSRNERCKATILAAATSAFDPVRELDRQLLRAITSRFLEERCEYEDNEHDGKHVQYHRCRSPGRQQSCFPLRMHPPSPS